ncbi:MAG: uracil-DNA glycosylase [Bacteroidia bacterium]|nr:uracil-DNA glycosylase [Bacteroidia bacterium]MDW8235439.1 uracil-DNA glycosylase [Bacteroidia bacterium]
MTPELTEAIISCKACERLVIHREKVAQYPPLRYRGQTYWSRGVPGWGDPKARLWIIGLAPAAHGANRTGRMFTGDMSGEWLYRILYEMGWSTRPQSLHREDGLELKGVYISAAVRCAPPQNRPTASELKTCFPFLQQEWERLRPTVKALMPLGHIAYCQTLRLLGIQQQLSFAHGKYWKHEDWWIVCSYHPSQQNTYTRRLTWAAWEAVFRLAKQLCGGNR